MARTRQDIEFVPVSAGTTTEDLVSALDLREYHKVPVAYLTADGTWRELVDSAVIADADDNIVSSRVVGADYHVQSFRDLLDTIQQFGAESGLELVRIGKNRANLLAEYKLPARLSHEVGQIRVGDLVEAGLTLSASNDGLNATWLRALMRRLACLNGARVTHDGAEFQLRHSARMTDEVLNRAGKAVEQLISTTGIYTGWLRRMAEIAISPEEARAFLRILAYPATAIREQAKLKGELTWQKLEPIHTELTKESRRAIAWSNDSERFSPNQAYRSMVDSWQYAPGADTSSLAGVYHAITHYHNHGASGSTATRAWSTMQDRGATQIALASQLLDSYMESGSGSKTLTISAD